MIRRLAATIGAVSLPLLNGRRLLCCDTSASHIQATKRAGGPFLGWIVADMDGTLVGQPGFRHGRYSAPALTESPCLEPLCRWLRSGGGLLVITSDDGNGPLKRIVNCIPEDVRDRVLLSTSDGAALFTIDAFGDPHHVNGYGQHLCLTNDSSYLDEVYEVAKAIYVRFFQALANDPTGLDTFDDAHKLAYSQLIDRVQRGETTFEEALKVDNLIRPAGVRHRGTMIWRTQAGPWSLWLKHGEGTEWEQLCSRGLVAPFTSVVLLGLPKRFSEPHCTALQMELKRLGLVASRAPNSVWLKRPGANKSVPVYWLQEQHNAAQFGFSLRDAVAFGDNPSGNDKPLSEFQGSGMPFISVGTDSTWNGLQVGGLERGSAAVIEQLAFLLEEEIEMASQEQRAPRSLESLGLDTSKIVSKALLEVEGPVQSSEPPQARL